MADLTTVQQAHSLLWYTDRSRYKTGTGRCGWQRYLSYHAGPTGYGLRHKSESIPLATGLSVHEGLAAFAQVMQARDQLTDVAETRAIIQAVQAAYLAKVEARGFLGILSSDQTALIIQEQSTLISGLLWALRLKFLPWFHEQYRLIESEQERSHFLTCTCGAAPLDTAEHVRRGCTGIVLMLRTDVLAAKRTGGSFAYFEAKTTGWDSPVWAEQWETDPQLGLGTLDIPQKYGGIEVTELYIVGLNKGRRMKDKYEGAADDWKKQQSPLCYGFCKPSNPPLEHDDWLPAYEWTTDDGQIKRKSRAHRRRGVWELAQSDWPTWLAYQGHEPDLPPEEYWVRMLPHSLLDKVCFVLGPYNRQDHQIASMRRAITGEEERWQRVLWQLYDLQSKGYGWASEEFQGALDRLVARSWDCRRFGKDHQCEFVSLCHRQSGWETPIESGLYQPRLPHHQPELEQAIERGLLPETAEGLDEEEAP
jgi:hypothetical protein